MTSRPASACVSDAQSRPDSSFESGSLDIELKYAWKPGIWAQFPWQGLGSLILVVLLTGASAGIIAFSHDSLIDRWRVGRIEVQPQVWLAVFSTIVNALLAFALTLGVTINFWKRAGRGTTLRELHDIYESAAILGAMKTLLRGSWNVVVFACIIVTVCMARDPLFQRASVVENVQRVTADAVDIRSALFVPDGFFKITEDDPHFSPDFKHALLNMFVHDIPYDVGNIPCPDGCKTMLKGFGFVPICESLSYDYDISDSLMANDIHLAGCRSAFGYPDSIHDSIHNTRHNLTHCLGLFGLVDELKMTAYDLEYDVFEYDDIVYDNSVLFIGDGFGLILSKPGEIRITTKFKDMPTCKGFAQTRMCTLRQGVVEYAVMLRNETISLQHPHWQNDTVLYTHGRQNQSYVTEWLEAFSMLTPAYKYDISHDLRASRFETQSYVNCNTWGKRPASNMSCTPTADAAFTFRERDRFRTQGDRSKTQEREASCELTFRDPTQDILDDIRNFAFRVSLIAGPLTGHFGNTTDWVERTSNWTQRVEFHDGIKVQTVYKAKWPFLAAAVIVSLVGVLSVASLFWGWWEMGRSVSLNPLEVGMAFNAPIFRIVNSNSRRSQIVKTMGSQKVKHGGYIAKPETETGLTSESESVSMINESASMSESGGPVGSSQQLSRSRLRIELEEDDDDQADRKGWVMTPRPGDMFS